jgi:hypothetical protein
MEELTRYLRQLLAGEKLTDPEVDRVLKEVFDQLERRGRTVRSGLDVSRAPRTPEPLRGSARREKKHRFSRMLSKGKLSGPELDDLLDGVLAALERDGLVPPTVFEVSCTPGTLSACPASSSLVFSASGFRARNYVSAYAEPLDHDAEPIFYFSDEDGCPVLAQPADGSRSELTVPLSASHRRGRYRLHAFLADGDIGRDEMIAGTRGINGIAVRLKVELVIVD